MYQILYHDFNVKYYKLTSKRTGVKLFKSRFNIVVQFALLPTKRPVRRTFKSMFGYGKKLTT